MQVYKSLDILSNKVTKQEAQGIEHHLISEVEVEEQFDVTQFVKRADQLIKEIGARGKLPIIVGGTCYYGYNLFVRKYSNQLSEFEQLECSNSPNSDHSHLEKEFEKFAFEMTRHNTKKYLTFINSFFKHKQTIKE